MNTISLRPLCATDIDGGHALSQRLGWSHRLEDWRFTAQFGGGWGAFDDQTLVGTALWSTYGETHGAIGLVIVSDALQGKGIGRKLMTAAMGSLQGRVIGLCATPAGQPLYEKLGFVGAGTVVQHQSNAFTVPADAHALLADNERIRLVDIANRQERATLIRMMSDVVAYDRSKVIDALYTVGEGIVVERDSTIAGCAFRRLNGRGYAIAPVIAQDERIAKALYAYWLARSPGHFVRTDINAGSGLGPWLTSLGLPVRSTVLRMRRAALPSSIATPSGPHQEFAIFSQGLG